MFVWICFSLSGKILFGVFGNVWGIFRSRLGKVRLLF